MTPTTSVITLGLMSATGFTVAAALPSPSADAIPWKDIAGGGAAVLMLVALVVFLRFLSQDRAARDAERVQDREHVEKVVGQCTETSLTIHRETTASSERREAALHQLVRDVTSKT